MNEGRSVSVDTVDRGRVTLPEPSWCLGHDDEPVGYRADVTHHGAPVEGVFVVAGVEVELLTARLSWAPFAEVQREPLPVADVEDFPPTDPEQLRQLAAALVVHAGRLRNLAAALEQAREEAS